MVSSRHFYRKRNSREQNLFSGEKQVVKNPPLDLTLVTYLREHLQLTGTKVACGEAGCGSCTVTLTGKDYEGKISHKAINSCITKLWTLHGTAITTVEGLGTPRSNLHPVQERIHKSHGIQCGFCTPGMVMSMSSELRNRAGLNETIDIEDVKKCLQGNLCRCTGYANIIEGFKTFCSEKSPHVDPKVPVEVTEGSLIHGIQLKNGEQRCYSPTDLNHLKEVLKTLDDFQFIQGGTGDYGVEKSNKSKNLVYLGNITELKHVQVKEGQEIFLGSCIKLSEAMEVLQNFPCFLPFCEAISKLASPQVRNVASIGGAIFWAHPSSDLWPLFLVYGCKVMIDCLDGSDPKEIPIADAQKGLVLQLVIPWPAIDFEGQFKKMARRKEFDLAILNMGALLKRNGAIIEKAKIAFGGTDKLLHEHKGPRSTRLAQSTMAYLDGKSVEEVIEMTLQKAIIEDLEPNTSSYRVNLALYFVQTLLKQPPVKDSMAFFKSHQFYTKFWNEGTTGLVHKPVPHLWGEELACGTAVFVDDMEPMKNGLTVVLIRSERSHAKISKLDFTAALQCEGVVGIVSALDVPGDQNLWGLFQANEEIFASEKVLYHGQIIAGIVCTNKKFGSIAKTSVIIDYEELPFVLNLKHARHYLKMDLEDLEVLGGEQVICRKQFDLEEPLKNSIKLSGSLRVGSAEHFYMEPHSVMAVPVKEKDELIVYLSTQEVASAQAKLVKALNLPMSKIIVKNKRCGGGFGGKERMHSALIAAVAANKFRRPVKLILTRAEDMNTTGGRHESIMDYEVAVDRTNGKIIDAKFKAWANAGSSTDLSSIWVNILLLRSGGGYTLPNFEGRGRAVRTNSPSNTAFRGFGGPEASVFIETIIDRIAHELNMSPIDVRLVNLTKENDLLHHSQSRIKGCTLRQCWDECMAKSNYEAKLQAIKEFNLAHDDVKRGMSVIPFKFEPNLGDKVNMKGNAFIRVYEDGSVLLTHGGIEMGQGLHTKMIQVASTALGISADLIHINEISTETLANTVPTGGSCGTDLNGPAVLDACEKLVNILEPYKNADPEASWRSWVQAANLDRVNLNVTGFYKSDFTYNFAQQTGDYFTYLTYGVGVVLVEVNCKTGQVDVLSADMVMDLGKSLNPAIDIGQVHGAFVQGMGTVLTEQLVRDVKTGKLLTEGPSHYKIPTIEDIPKEFNVTLLDNKGVEGPTSAIYSSKGVGEPPINFSAGIVIAVKDAIAQYRKQHGNMDWFFLEPPCTPEKLRKSAHPGEASDYENMATVEM